VVDQGILAILSCQRPSTYLSFSYTNEDGSKASIV